MDDQVDSMLRRMSNIDEKIQMVQNMHQSNQIQNESLNQQILSSSHTGNNASNSRIILSHDVSSLHDIESEDSQGLKMQRSVVERASVLMEKLDADDI